MVAVGFIPRDGGSKVPCVALATPELPLLDMLSRLNQLAQTDLHELDNGKRADRGRVA